MKHHSQTVFTPSDTVEVFVDHAGHAPRPMPKVDAGNQATVVSCSVHAHIHFGGAVHDPNAKGGTIHLTADETILLTGSDAASAASASQVFAMAPQGGTLTVQRGSAKTEMVFRD